MADFLEDISSSYNRVAGEYARQLFDEIQYKPLDQDLLMRFARLTKDKGIVCDMGCGPGQIADYLNKQGVDVVGLDLSEEMLMEARRLNPGIEFKQGNFFALEFDRKEFAGIAAFYSIVNIPSNRLTDVFGEWRRVLKSEGRLLLSFHIGDEERHLNRFLDQDVSITFYFFNVDVIVKLLAESGFDIEDIIIRYPYKDIEHQSKRAYIIAIKT